MLTLNLNPSLNLDLNPSNCFQYVKESILKSVIQSQYIAWKSIFIPLIFCFVSLDKKQKTNKHSLILLFRHQWPCICHVHSLFLFVFFVIYLMSFKNNFIVLLFLLSIENVGSFTFPASCAKKNITKMIIQQWNKSSVFAGPQLLPITFYSPLRYYYKYLKAAFQQNK